MAVIRLNFSGDVGSGYLMLMSLKMAVAVLAKKWYKDRGMGTENLT